MHAHRPFCVFRTTLEASFLRNAHIGLCNDTRRITLNGISVQPIHGTQYNHQLLCTAPHHLIDLATAPLPISKEYVSFSHAILLQYLALCPRVTHSIRNAVRTLYSIVNALL
jgi:hypothetical protein